jgi:hypothetical protein
MAYNTTLTSSVNVNFSWNQSSVDDTVVNNVANSNTVSDAGIFNYVGSVAPSGASLFYENNTIDIDETNTYELTALARTILTGSENVTFNKVYSLYIENTSTGIANDCYMSLAGVGGWTGLGLGSGQILIAAGNVICFTNKVGGWSVTDTSKYLKILGPTTSGLTSYRIGIIGGL